MSQKDSLAKRIDQLSSKVAELRRTVFFQAACVAGLRDYVLSKEPDPEAAHSEWKKLVMNLYDQRIGEIENKHPADAADIDIRPDLDEDDQSRWYFPKSSE